MATSANIINHIGLVLDASGSMAGRAEQLIKVVDGQTQYLAQRSKELDQETRISVWTFSYAQDIKCAVWDMDVLRLPSIRTFYRATGQTALIDATLKAVSDLSETPERYGDHSFLMYVLTDGAENASRARATDLQNCFNGLKDHWTVAALVPDALAISEAKRFGFPAGNIQTWDTTSAQGVDEVGAKVRAATDTYMTNRASGIRSTRNLFSTDATTVNAATIAQAGLMPLGRGKYLLAPVPKDTVIKEFTEACGHKYLLGRGFYELSKPEKIQPQKEIAIVERGPAAKVFVGKDARQMIGLSDVEVRVKPDFNREYAVFVQSTAINRILRAGTKYLYLL